MCRISVTLNDGFRLTFMSDLIQGFKSLLDIGKGHTFGTALTYFRNNGYFSNSILQFFVKSAKTKSEIDDHTYSYKRQIIFKSSPDKFCI